MKTCFLIIVILIVILTAALPCFAYWYEQGREDQSASGKGGYGNLGPAATTPAVWVKTYNIPKTDTCHEICRGFPLKETLRCISRCRERR